jgi:glycopeptide antibiotics resistance protein
VLVAVCIAPFNCADISKVTVLQFRLDYLVHVVMFAPLVVLWRMVFPRHPWWVALGTGLGLAAGLEGIQYVLSYRSWNVNDMIGNMIGILLGSGLAFLTFLVRNVKNARPDPSFPKEKT